MTAMVYGDQDLACLDDGSFMMRVANGNVGNVVWIGILQDK